MDKDSFFKRRVAIVVPAKKFFCLAGALWTQRYGPLQVASVTSQAGYFVRLYNEELGLRVSPVELAREFDVIGFSCKSAAITRAEEIAGAVKMEAGKLGRRVVTVLGGEHISVGGDSQSNSFKDIVGILGKRGKVIPVIQRLGNNLVQRMVVKEVADSQYLEMIQTVEKEFYIENNGKEQLQEELLRKRYEERTRARGNTH